MIGKISHSKVNRILTDVRILGWLTVMGWQAAFASGSYLASSLVQGLIVLNNPNYSPHPWHLVLLYWANVTVAIIVNTVISRALPKVETIVLVLHIFGFVAILIPLVYFAPHGNASDVFTLFLNQGGWSTQGLSFMVGMIGPAFSLLGKIHLHRLKGTAFTAV